MSATVRHLPVRGDIPQLVTKQQLARSLGRSERWVEMRAAEGMPRAGLDRAGRRQFDLHACRAWLDARSEQQAAHTPLSTVERLEQLEAQVAELTAKLERMGGNR